MESSGQQGRMSAWPLQDCSMVFYILNTALFRQIFVYLQEVYTHISIKISSLVPFYTMPILGINALSVKLLAAQILLSERLMAKVIKQRNDIAACG